MNNAPYYISAYGLAKKHGYIGTEAEWLESLHGADGTGLTHSWNGTTLVITSESGTSSADLKGDPGDYTGEQAVKAMQEQVNAMQIGLEQVFPLITLADGTFTKLAKGGEEDRTADLATPIVLANYTAVEVTVDLHGLAIPDNTSSSLIGFSFGFLDSDDDKVAVGSTYKQTCATGTGSTGFPYSFHSSIMVNTQGYYRQVSTGYKFGTLVTNEDAVGTTPIGIDTIKGVYINLANLDSYDYYCGGVTVKVRGIK